MAEDYYKGYLKIKVDLSKEGSRPARWHWVRIITKHVTFMGMDCLRCEKVNKSGDHIEGGANTQVIRLIAWNGIEVSQNAEMDRMYGQLEVVGK